jgi:hypothetical protein
MCSESVVKEERVRVFETLRAEHALTLGDWLKGGVTSVRVASVGTSLVPEPVSCPPLYPPKLCTDALLFRCRWTTGTKLRPSPRPSCAPSTPSRSEIG